MAAGPRHTPPRQISCVVCVHDLRLEIGAHHNGCLFVYPVPANTRSPAVTKPVAKGEPGIASSDVPLASAKGGSFPTAAGLINTWLLPDTSKLPPAMVLEPE